METGKVFSSNGVECMQGGTDDQISLVAEVYLYVS